MNMSPEARHNRISKDLLRYTVEWKRRQRRHIQYTYVVGHHDWTQIAVDDLDSGQDPIMIVGGWNVHSCTPLSYKLVQHTRFECLRERTLRLLEVLINIDF